MASISLGGRLDDRDKYQSLSLLKSILSVPKLNWRKIVCAAQPYFSNIDAVPQPQLFYMQCFELWYPFDIPKSVTPQYNKNWPIFLPLKSYVKLIFRIIEVQKRVQDIFPQITFSLWHFSLRRFSPNDIFPHFFSKFAQVRHFSPKDVFPYDIFPHFFNFMAFTS